jgi:cytochrome c553
MKSTARISVALALAGAFSLAHAQGAAGDAAAGSRKIAMCIGCHGIPGYQASFPEVYRVPMIAGQGDKYIVAALNAYKKGERKHPTMRAIADSLSDQDMADVAAFYAQQAGAVALPEQAVAPSPEVGALLTKGACNSCHGANYSKPIDASYPKIAGQHADYLFNALKAYQVDKNANIGRSNAIMAGQARQFKPAELKMIAAYLASLPGELKTVPQPKMHTPH